MSLPDWADARFSRELAISRSRGEGQNLEFKREFPKQTTDLAKEIAAFATSNQGMILLGVSDSGDLVGLADTETPEQRDNLLKRLAGICRGTVKPAVTPTAGYAIEDEKVVLVINIPKGSQPVYYCDHRPYVRHLNESRPAEPHEIVDLVRSWVDTTTVVQDDDEDNSSSELLTELVRVLTDIIIYGKEIEQRDINPWLDLVLTQFRYGAATLRQLASLPVTLEHGLSPELESLADDLDEILGQPIVSGYWPRFQASVNKAVDKARNIKTKFFDSEPMPSTTMTSAKESILSDARKLGSLDKRLERLVEQGRVDELMSEASEIGLSLLHLGYLQLDQIREGLSQSVQAVGHRLHLVETTQHFMDGGQSLRKLLDEIRQCRTMVDSIAAALE